MEACRAHGVAVDYLRSADGDHGFRDPRDEQAVYLAIERFLARHLGGRATDDPSPADWRENATKSGANPANPH